MDLRFVSSLLTIAETGSIAQAARQIGVTPSALSQRIAALEAELGLKLLIREGRRSKPTKDALRLFPKFRALVHQADELRRAAHEGIAWGPFRLGAISTVLTDDCPKLITEIAKQAPELKLSVEPGASAALYQRLEAGGLDAAVIVGAPFDYPKSVLATQIQVQPLVMIAPVGVSGSASDLLLDNKLVAYSPSSWGGRLCWDAVTGLCPNPEVFCELDALETIALLVQQGVGVSVVPDWRGLRQRFTDLQYIPIAPDLSREIHLVYLRSADGHPAINLMKTLLSR